MYLTLTLEEVHSLVGNQVSCQVLRGVHKADNGRSSKICAFEKLDVARLLCGLLEIDDTSHHGESLGHVRAGTSAKAFDGLCGLIELALSDEPVGRFWCEKKKNEKWCREHPLERNRSSDRG